ncbi:DUF58 domain-containing protein [Bacillaceae bacterium SIJ1]|uniref:DUF58 domain-containing protein n=1 Tax=Litoribacterium kuwaitense TaxID=1398745 RepID=UPI0013EC1B71|nr:DUF58 domain-containing protein [Litoribacterium kuwaitense]NGP45765.1 DUF58 domain-containing protein [Litoribacterium kuwaitense]
MRKTYWPLLKTTVTFLLFFFFMGIVFSYAMFHGGFVSWFLFYATLPLTLYLLITMIYPLRNFRVERMLSTSECKVGETVKVTLTIKRTMPFPLFYLLIHDQLPMEAVKGTPPVRALLFPGLKRTLSYSYELQSVRRGEYHFQGVTLSTGDPLGFVQKHHFVSLKDELLVFPEHELAYYEHTGQNRQEGDALARMFDVIDTTMAVGAREYVPGDKFSWVDWKSTARKRTLMTKEFEQRSGHTVRLLLDRSEQQNVAPESFERNISFAVSLAKAIIRKGTTLHFLSLGKDTVNIHLEALKNQESSFRQVLHHLARAERDGEAPFAKQVQETLMRSEKEVTMVFVVQRLDPMLVTTLIKAKETFPYLVVFMPGEDSRDAGQRTLEKQLSAHGMTIGRIRRENIGKAWFEVTK